jgi:hypothetical protein
MDTNTNILSKEFILNLTQMITEFDLVFDYVDKKVIKSLYTYKSKIENDSAFKQNEMKSYIKIMEPYKDNLAKIVLPTVKVKTHEFNFLNDLLLFDNILEFKIFSSENKNTKKTLVQYLYNMYMSCILVDLPLDTANLELTSFMEMIQARIPKPVENKVRHKRHTPSNNDTNDVFNSLLSNPDIINMAKELTQDLQTQNIDPMSLMSSIISGKPDKKLEKIVNNISNKLEQKISTGEISKEALEQQAHRIIDVVENSDVTNQLPMLKTLINQTKKQ